MLFDCCREHRGSFLQSQALLNTSSRVSTFWRALTKRFPLSSSSKESSLTLIERRFSLSLASSLSFFTTSRSSMMVLCMAHTFCKRFSKEPAKAFPKHLTGPVGPRWNSTSMLQVTHPFLSSLIALSSCTVGASNLLFKILCVKSHFQTLVEGVLRSTLRHGMAIFHLLQQCLVIDALRSLLLELLPHVFDLTNAMLKLAKKTTRKNKIQTEKV